MQKIPIRLASMLLPFLLVTVTTGNSDAKVMGQKTPITRSERCSRLSRQVDKAIQNHAKGMQVTEAKALQKKADRYCAARHQAQGIRTLANALKVLGVAPVDPNQ